MTTKKQNEPKNKDAKMAIAFARQQGETIDDLVQKLVTRGSEQDTEIMRLKDRIHELETDERANVRVAARDTEISQLNARIANLEEQNLGQKNLLVQLHEILGNANILANNVIFNVTDTHGNKVAAGLKLKELQDLISCNAVALGEITKEWKKE